MEQVVREVHDAKVGELCELRGYRASELVMAKNKGLQAWHEGDRGDRDRKEQRSSSRKTLKKKKKKRRRDGSSETIVGEVKGMQGWRKRWRDGSCEEVMEEIEGSEAGERGDGGRERSSYGVVMEAEASQRAEAPYLCR